MSGPVVPTKFPSGLVKQFNLCLRPLCIQSLSVLHRQLSQGWTSTSLKCAWRSLLTPEWLETQSHTCRDTFLFFSKYYYTPLLFYLTWNYSRQYCNPSSSLSLSLSVHLVNQQKGYQQIIELWLHKRLMVYFRHRTGQADGINTQVCESNTWDKLM